MYSCRSSIVSANLIDCRVLEVITTASVSSSWLFQMLLSMWSMYSQIRACLTLSSVAMLITIWLSWFNNFMFIISFSLVYINNIMKRLVCQPLLWSFFISFCLLFSSLDSLQVAWICPPFFECCLSLNLPFFYFLPFLTILILTW